MLGNINIKAGESTYSQSSKSNSRNLGGSIGTNGVSANIDFSEAQSSFDQTTFNNSQNSISNQNYRDRSDRAKERGNADTINITNISSTISSGSDLNIISGNNTIIQSSKLVSGDNLTIDAGNNLLLLTAKNASIKNVTNSNKATYTFSNGNSGHVDIKAINNEITSNINNLNNNLNNDNIGNNLNPNLNLGVNSNLNLNANNSIIVQYQEGTMENLTSSTSNNFNYNFANILSKNYNSINLANDKQIQINIANDNQDSASLNNDHQELQYLKILNNLSQTNPNKITLDSIANTSQNWDKTTRGLTTASQAAIAVAAVAVAVGTGGLGSGISGAMMTAAATTASTTATIAATTASMNTDSNFLNSTNSIADNSWKATSSDESLKNMAISAAVAGVGYGIGEWMKAEGVNPSLESGTMENSRVGVNVEKVDGQWFAEGKDIKANWFDTYVTGNQNPVFKAFNTTPGSPSFTGFHDAMNFPAGVNQVTIAPYYAMSQCAASPTLCAMFPDIFIKVGTWGQVDTNLNIYKKDYGQKNN